MAGRLEEHLRKVHGLKAEDTMPEGWAEQDVRVEHLDGTVTVETYVYIGSDIGLTEAHRRDHAGVAGPWQHGEADLYTSIEDEVSDEVEVYSDES